MVARGLIDGGWDGRWVGGDFVLLFSVRPAVHHQLAPGECKREERVCGCVGWCGSGRESREARNGNPRERAREQREASPSIR